MDFYTPAELVEILKISPDSVMRLFGDLPGVIDLGSPETRKKRRYRVIRIPKVVLERFLLSHAA